MKRMDIRPLRNEADYDWALGEVANYFEREPERGTPAADRFDVLATLIEAYEAKHWPIDPPDPIDAIRYKMEIAGLKPSDLGRLIGSKSRASEILRRKRPLTLRQAYKLNREWQIPAEILLQPYRLRAA
jgi:HTH-type transcriptional regulator/antitoxin HigA